MTWRVRGAAWSIAAAVVIAAMACGDNNNNKGGGGGGGGGGGTGDTSSNQNGALKVEIQNVEVPESGAPVLTFRVTSDGTAVTDLAQEVKNGVVPSGSPPSTTFPWVSPIRVVLSKYDPTTSEFTSYYTVNATGQPFTPPGGTAQQPKQATATQATFDAGPTDATLDQRLTHQGDGVYKYTLAAIPAGAQVDRTKTHTAGIWLTRHTAAGEPGTSSATSTRNFIPAGGTPKRLQIVSNDACNACHAPAIAAHDERLGATVCQTCHSPQSTDPESGNSVDFKVMVHKIHMGGDLPSAQGATGQPYTIVGFRQNVFEFDKSWMHDVRDCTVCHKGTDADRYKTNANQAACTSCHDTVKFDGSGAAACALGTTETAPCNHAQVGATACTTCHTADAAGIGVATVHVPLAKKAEAYKYEIVNVTTGADRKPVVQVRVTKNGTPVDLAADPAYKQTLSRLNVKIGWHQPGAADYTNVGSGATSPGQPVDIPVVGATGLTPAATPVSGQTNVYQVTSPTAITDGVTTYSVFIDGRPIENGEELPVKNVIQDYAIGGGQAAARRQVVDIAKCDSCHGQLSAHGANRNDVIQVCAVCHNPRATDKGRRTATATNPACAATTTEQSIDFKRMIHEIHGGSIRGNDLTICGFGSNPITFEAGAEVPQLDTVQNCTLCHTGETYQVPPAGSTVPLDTTYVANVVADQTDDTTTPAVIAVCTACHDNAKFTATAGLPSCSSLATVNSEPCAHTGGEATVGTTCVACHGKGAPFDIVKFHDIKP
ncbi:MULTISPECIES: OmcA/MtrC family decaheme c-type cytochrome [Anaeromyxobacter]|uniref:OmcA/MtrC family decaheme c-type cytochrome n=1 Tax=Anaeromyxobacter TaxID=161492 RepID=UPI001F570C85|nr:MULTISPECIES: OmcA/MtrC family decaheme c-type cytochrome [unclassified Anaeromyxobacter]